MTQFRDRLAAMGRGQASPDEVMDSLEALLIEAPDEAEAARALLDAARRGGLSEAVHRQLHAHVDAVLAAGEEATAMRPGRADAATLFPEDGEQEATRFLLDDAEPTRASPRAAARREAPDPTTASSPDDDATRIDDPTLGDETTLNPRDGDVTTLNTRIGGAETTQLNTGYEPTRLSGQDDDDTFDILGEDALAAAEVRRQETTGASWPTDSTTPRPSGVGALTFEQGSTLRNRFVLEQKLGEGGMGAVWKGIDKLKQEARDRNPYVAIKLLQGDFREHPEAFIALQRETAKQQRLAHPNIATVFDFDRDDSTNTVFMTMEVLSGSDLAAYIRRQVPVDGLPYADAMALIEQLGAGLGYAHQAGLVHSDLKPGNCFLTEEGNVKLLDFGIARASKTKADAEGETTVFDPGELGALTPAYATIEMFEGLDPDPRDDIYALAIIAYQLLTGKHPYGRKNAPKAEEAGLTVPPVDKLTKAQNRALARGLAFRRAERTATVEEFLEGMRVRKTNRVLTWGLPAAVVAVLIAVGWPMVTDHLARQEREAVISTVTSSQPDALEVGLAMATALQDPDQRRRVLTDPRTRDAVVALFERGGENDVRRGLTLLQRVGPEFTDDIKKEAAVEDAVIAVYRERTRAAFAPELDRFDFPAAQAEVEALKSIYPRAAGTFRLEQELKDERAQSLAALEDRFNRLIDSGDLLPRADGTGIFGLRERAARIDPTSSLLTTKLVTLTAGELAQQAIDGGDYLRAAALLQASLDYAPEQDELGDLRYQVEEELRRQRNAQLVEDIETRLRAETPQLTDLAGFQAVRDDLVRLADLAPRSEVLEALQERLTTAFDAELERLATAGDWSAAEALLVDFARLFPLDYLHDRRDALSAAESEAGFALEMSDARRAAVQARAEAIDALLEEPVFGSDWEIALQVPFKEMIALLPAGDASLLPVRERIARLHIEEAEAARERELTSRARALVARGREFYPNHAPFDAQLARIAETDAVIERKRAEAARLARIERNYNQVINRAKTNETQAAEEALAQLERDAGDTESERLAVARAELGLAYGRLAESPAAREDWGQALKLLQRGLELAPGSEALNDAEQRYRAEYQKVVAVERVKELLQGNEPLATAGLDAALEQVKADFPERYATRYEAEFAELAAARLASRPVRSADDLTRLGEEVTVLRRHFRGIIPAALDSLAGRMTERTTELESQDVNLAASYLAAARRIAPDSRSLASIKLKLPSKLAEQGKSLVAEGRLSAAQGVLAEVMRTEPEAPNVLDFSTALTARRQLAELNFDNFEKYKRARRARQGQPFLDKALEAWTDNPDYQAELAALNTAPARVGRSDCDPRKAGLGASSRATCFDEFGEQRGPVLVVIPPGSGNRDPYAIGKLEVTVGEYNLFCQNSGCPTLPGDDRLPVTGITLQQAESYLAWLSQQTGARYRLPSSAEWEHAALAGGDQPPKDFNCTVTVGNQTLKGQSLVTALSGRQNGWGLMNYVGNAREWVRESGDTVVARGGAYTDAMSKCDISLREAHGLGADPVTGFRVLRELG